jgi:hypothetical protein
VEEARRRAKRSQDAPRAIINDTRCGASSFVLSGLPSYGAMSRQLERDREIPGTGEVNRVGGKISGDFSRTIQG